MPEIRDQAGRVLFSYEGSLKSIDWDAVSLEGAVLTHADLQGAWMVQSRLKNANLSGSNLYWADLTGSDLSGANLKDCDMCGTNLTHVNFRGACLDGADLRRNNLGTPATVEGADFTDTDLSLTHMEGVLWDENTRFLTGFSPDAAGMVRKANQPPTPASTTPPDSPVRP